MTNARITRPERVRGGRHAADFKGQAKPVDTASMRAAAAAKAKATAGQAAAAPADDTDAGGANGRGKSKRG